MTWLGSERWGRVHHDMAWFRKVGVGGGGVYHGIAWFRKVGGGGGEWYDHGLVQKGGWGGG